MILALLTLLRIWAIDTYNALAGSTLTRGKQTAVAIGAGATVTQDVLCVNESTLVVEVDMSGAANGDLTVQVRPYETDNATIMPISMPVDSQTGPTFDAGTNRVYYIGRFNVQGQDRVRVLVTNNNVGAQTINRLSWRFA